MIKELDYKVNLLKVALKVIDDDDGLWILTWHDYVFLLKAKFKQEHCHAEHHWIIFQEVVVFRHPEVILNVLLSFLFCYQNIFLFFSFLKDHLLFIFKNSNSKLTSSFLSLFLISQQWIDLINSIQLHLFEELKKLIIITNQSKIMITFN